MSLKEKVEKEIVTAIKEKNTIAKIALRALKTAIVNAESEKGSMGKVDEVQETQILNRLLKQRKEAADIFAANGRKEASEQELAEAKVISVFLPKQLSEEDVRRVVSEVITNSKADSMQDMGRIMGLVTKQLSGKASGKVISLIVKDLLS